MSLLVAKGGAWVFALRIVQRLFSLARLVILARILAPSDFGLLGIALMALAALETFSQTGFQQALVHKKGDIKPYLDSAWTILIIRGLILSVILFFSAPYVANFFSAPNAEHIIQVIGISFLVQAFTNIGVVFFEKELDFKKHFIYQVSGTLADFLVAVSAAILLRSVWALVFGILAGHFTRLVVSYLVHPYRPGLNFELSGIKELFGFGKWIFGSSVLVFFLAQGGNIVVGKILGTVALGYYTMAFRISNFPTTEYSAMIARVTFPAYVKIRENIPQLREAYLKVLQLSSFISIPIAGGIFILAPEFTTIFLGEKWLSIIPAMQVLAVYSMFASIVFPGPVFMAVGRPELRTKLQFLNLIIMAILIYPFTLKWGIFGTAIAVTSYVGITSIVAIAVVLNIIGSDYKKPLMIIVLPFFNTLVMITVIYLLKAFIVLDINIGWFLFLVGLGIWIYLFIANIFDRLFAYGGKKLIYDQFARLSR